MTRPVEVVPVHDADMIHGSCSPYCQGCAVERLRAENERLRDALEMIRDSTAPWHTCTHSDDANHALADAPEDHP